MVRLGYEASCQECGARWEGEIVLPFGGGVGETRQVFASCVGSG